MTEVERVHFKIALPVDLKKQLEHQAVESRRSLSAEIIARLEASLAPRLPSDDNNWLPLPPDARAVMERIAAEQEKIRAQLEDITLITKAVLAEGASEAENSVRRPNRPPPVWRADQDDKSAAKPEARLKKDDQES